MEILVVVLLLGILAAAAIPSFAPRSDLQAEMEGARIKETINHAQALAFARNTDFQVSFKVGGKLVALSRYQSGAGPFTPDSDDYSWSLEHGTINTADFGGSDTVRFDTDGRPISDGAVVVDYDGLQMKIAVTSITGFVSISGIP